MSEQPILKPEHFQVSRFQKRQLKGKRCKLPQWGPVRSPGHQRIFACNLGWEIAASGDEFPSWYPSPYFFYMRDSNTFPKLGRVLYGMDPIGLRSGRAQTQDPAGNRHLWLYIQGSHAADARVMRDSAVIPRWPSAAILDIMEPEIASFNPRPRKP